MNRTAFEAHYIAKHFHDALRLEEITYRDCLRWMQDAWIGNKYNDEEIQTAWLTWQAEIIKAVEELNGSDHE